MAVCQDGPSGTPLPLVKLCGHLLFQSYYFYPRPMKSKAGYTTWACGYFSQVMMTMVMIAIMMVITMTTMTTMMIIRAMITMIVSQEISNNFEQLYTEHKQEFANVWKEIAKRLNYYHHCSCYQKQIDRWNQHQLDLKPLYQINRQHYQSIPHEGSKATQTFWGTSFSMSRGVEIYTGTGPGLLGTNNGYSHIIMNDTGYS